MFQFKTFRKSEDFVRWQAKNPGIEIYQFQPMVLDLGGVVNEMADGAELDIATTVGCFVVYGIKDV